MPPAECNIFSLFLENVTARILAGPITCVMCDIFWLTPAAAAAAPRPMNIVLTVGTLVCASAKPVNRSLNVARQFIFSSPSLSFLAAKLNHGGIVCPPKRRHYSSLPCLSSLSSPIFAPALNVDMTAINFAISSFDKLALTGARELYHCSGLLGFMIFQRFEKQVRLSRLLIPLGLIRYVYSIRTFVVLGHINSQSCMAP